MNLRDEKILSASTIANCDPNNDEVVALFILINSNISNYQKIN